MDCVTAQSLISDAMDRQPVDAAALAQAREHCRDCAQCSRFVRGQLVAKRAPLPQPPIDLADRVMVTVRAEVHVKADAAALGAAGGDEPVANATTDEQPTPQRLVATLAPPAPRTRAKLPRPFAIAAAAAVVVLALLAAGGIVIFGMQQVAPQTATSRSTYLIGPNAAQAPLTQVVPPGGSAAGSADQSIGSAPAGGGTSSRTGAAGPKDITVSGVVYSLTGPANVSTSSMPAIGVTNASLGDGSSPTRRDVRSNLSHDTVYVADDKGSLYAFARVTRTYLGLTYVLTASELTDYGQWPALPMQVQPPTSPDGQPTFTFDGTDQHGVKVYRLSASRATEGIAVAPQSDLNGPVSGDPNWTWWSILH